MLRGDSSSQTEVGLLLNRWEQFLCRQIPKHPIQRVQSGRERRRGPSPRSWFLAPGPPRDFVLTTNTGWQLDAIDARNALMLKVRYSNSLVASRAFKIPFWNFRWQRMEHAAGNHVFYEHMQAEMRRKKSLQKAGKQCMRQRTTC